MNLIGDAGATSLSEALQSNSTLTELYSYARRDRGARVASRKRARDARVQAQAHYESEGEEAHGAWNSARDVEFGSARTVQEADV